MMQSDSENEPEELTYLPAAQPLHIINPVERPYVPGPHAMQSPASSEPVTSL